MLITVTGIVEGLHLIPNEGLLWAGKEFKAKKTALKEARLKRECFN